VKKIVLLAACAVAAALAPLHSAYKGHADDRDVEAVLAVYPALKGTPADSCATCHESGDVRGPQGAAMRPENHCDYCHAVSDYGKKGARDTLNRYGAAYLAAGRGEPAVRAIAAKDADADGFTNEAELKAGTDPGNALSNPSVPQAPSRAYAVTALQALAPVRDVPVFVNTTKSRSGDSYSDYRGSSLWDILQAVGVTETVTAVDVLAADGYEHTFTIDELKKTWPQGPPVMGLGKADLGECGWVTYGSRRLEADKPLPGAPVMLAYEENGKALEPARFDPATGRLEGKGPARVIVPQFAVSPPDLPQFAAATCPEKVPVPYRFNDGYDHNGGASAYAIVAVRVKPLPKGTRDIDWQSAALRSLAEKQIVFFGALKGR
jgi:hypothetical protein